MLTSPKTVLLLTFLPVIYLSGCQVEQENSPWIKWNKEREVASGPAHVGRWKMNQSDWRYVDDPSVDITREGSIGVAWVNQSRKDVYFRLYDETKESEGHSPVNVSGTPDTFSWLPEVIVTDDTPRFVYMLWQEIIFSGGTHGGETFFVRSTDGGKSFEEPINLSNSVAGDGKGRLNRKRWDNGSLDLALGPSGTLYAAWTEYEGRLWLSRSTDRGKTFTDPHQLNSKATKPARGPSLAAGNNGTIYVAWTVGEDPEADIRFKVLKNYAQKAVSTNVVAKSDAHSDAPKVAVDGNGTVHLVYGESPDGPLKRYHVRYTRSTDNGESFVDSRNISTPHSETYPSVNYPSLGVMNDRVYVLWELFSDPTGHPRKQGLTLSRNGGDRFENPTVISSITSEQPGFNGSLQGRLNSKLSVNRSGDLAVVNSTIEPLRESHVWLLKGTTR